MLEVGWWGVGGHYGITALQKHLNPTAFWHFVSYGGGGGGLFGLDPENKVTVNGLIRNLVPIMVWMLLVNMHNFKLMAFLLLEIWRHQNFLSKMERVIAIRYLPPGFKQNSTKITFYAWKHLSWNKFIPPLHFHGFEAKQETLYAQFFKMSHFKNNCSNPPGESISLKFCQNVSNR